MTGDKSDILSRLRGALPNGWFSREAPILDALLSGAAAIFAFVFDLLAYAKLQTRISTATDGWLDLISADFFGDQLPRNGRNDAGFRAAIIAALFRERATRNGLAKMLADLTGNTPIIFEPGRATDALCIGANSYVGVVPVGSLSMPFQTFAQIKRAPGTGIPTVAGIGSNDFGIGQSGTAALISMDQIIRSVTDADIYAAAQATKPVGTVVWVAITD